MSKNSNSEITTKDSGFFTESVDDAKFIVACLVLKLRLMQKDNPISMDLKKALKKHKKKKLNNQQVLDSYLKLPFKDLISCRHKRFLQWIDNSSVFDFIAPMIGMGAAGFMLPLAAGVINENLLLGLLDFIPGTQVIGFSLISMLVFSAAIVFSECARSNPGSTGIHDYLNELDTYAALPFLYSMFDVDDKKGIEQTVEKDDKKSPSLT